MISKQEEFPEREPDAVERQASLSVLAPIPTATAKTDPKTARKPPRSSRSRTPVQFEQKTTPTALANDPVLVVESQTGEPNHAIDKINRNALNRSVLDDADSASRVRREAVALRDTVFPSEFLAAAGLDKAVSTLGARLHLLQFREAAGGPTDPVEQLLLDILALARLRVARVHALAEQATSPELIRTYLNTGCRLMSEISKTVLTLAAYRSQSRGTTPAATKTLNTELGSNSGGTSDE